MPGFCGASTANTTFATPWYKQDRFTRWTETTHRLTVLPKSTTLLITTAMERPMLDISQAEANSNEDILTNHLGSNSERVMLRKHLHLRRQRAAKACARCHQRKVRCDVSQSGLPCTNCRSDSKVCTINESRRGGKRQRLEG